LHAIRDPVQAIHWLEDGRKFEAQWLHPSPPPTRIVVADGKTTADEAYGLACQGAALLWRGDFQEARQMLNAMARRADRRQQRKSRTAAATPVGRSCPGIPSLSASPLATGSHLERAADPAQ
jgi:hypothetical protein